MPLEFFIVCRAQTTLHESVTATFLSEPSARTSAFWRLLEVPLSRGMCNLHLCCGGNLRPYVRSEVRVTDLKFAAVVDNRMIIAIITGEFSSKQTSTGTLVLLSFCRCCGPHLTAPYQATKPIAIQAIVDSYQGFIFVLFPTCWLSALELSLDLFLVGRR
jgi:hypothetical protein